MNAYSPNLDLTEATNLWLANWAHNLTLMAAPTDYETALHYRIRDEQERRTNV